jgi:cellulose synthase/poly-beta-1,6-N-acetylglucosamine synthase-like glycosyltransferase
MMRLVFVIGLELVLYTYLGYPALLWLLERFWLRRERKSVEFGDGELPFVSMVVPAYNEERVLPAKLANIAELDYPADRLEVLIGSDGSTDGTEDLVLAVDDPRVRLVAFKERRGKAALLNDLIQEARGDVIVFSDANTMFEPGALRRLVAPFADPEVGGVCGHLVLRAANTETSSESRYWRFEQRLKRVEGRLGAVLGGNGGIYAIRRRLYQRLKPTTIVDDFVIGLRVLQQGYRMVYAGDAWAWELTARNLLGEFERRARIGAGDFQALSWTWDLLLPSRGFVAFSYLSHKVLRWIMPFVLLGMTGISLLGLRDPFFWGVVAAEVVFLGLALCGHLFVSRRGGLFSGLRIAYYFLLMNTALLVGAIRFVRGTQSPAWRRTERSEAAASVITPI